MAQLRVFREDGYPLFDTNLITYGLVKSGYMTFQQYWTRKALRSAQLDPNNGANWTQSTVVSTPDASDGLWGFTVTNAKSPVVFITGTGTLNGSAVSGNSITFYYSNASTSTKFYCFDLMGDNIAGSPYLKTYTPDRVLTFNSLQPAMNIYTAIQAPNPDPRIDSFGRYLLPYLGGQGRVRQIYGTGPGNYSYTPQFDLYVDIPIGSGSEEYAAYLNFSRSAGIWDGSPASGSIPLFNYSLVEGAYGRVGGISFMFGASAATTQATPPSNQASAGVTVSQLPVDRFPIALVIKTASYPFPYN